MRRLLKSRTMCALLSVSTLLAMPLLSTVWGDSKHKEHAKKGPVHITMDTLHAAGGVPPGWQFTLPAGDSETGREVFVTMQCYTCHNIAGETFPASPPSFSRDGSGPHRHGGASPGGVFCRIDYQP